MRTATPDRSKHRTAEAIIRFAVAGLSSLLVVALAGLVVVEVRPGWLSGLRNAVPAPVPSTGAPARPGGAARSGSATGKGTTGTGTQRNAAEGGAPVLAALHPAAAAPGQVLTVSGQNLFSSDGTILVTLAGHPAPVHCPTSRECTITVPDLLGPPRTIRLAMRTTGGLSNALTLDYR